MNTSSRFVVAVHILTTLVIRPMIKKERCITSECIASSVNTNPVVIRRILSTLRKAGLVTSRTGPDGGSRLARNPEQIMLQAVCRAVDNKRLFHFHYSTPDQECPIGANIKKTLEGVFDKAEIAMKNVLGHVSVADIAEDIMLCADGFLQQDC